MFNHIRANARRAWTTATSRSPEEWLRTRVELTIKLERPTGAGAAALAALGLLAALATAAGYGWIRPNGPTNTTEGITVYIITLTAGLVLLYAVDHCSTRTEANTDERVERTPQESAVEQMTREAGDVVQRGGQQPDNSETQTHRS